MLTQWSLHVSCFDQPFLLLGVSVFLGKFSWWNHLTPWQIIREGVQLMNHFDAMSWTCSRPRLTVFYLQLRSETPNLPLLYGSTAVNSQFLPTCSDSHLFFFPIFQHPRCSKYRIPDGNYLRNLFSPFSIEDPDVYFPGDGALLRCRRPAACRGEVWEATGWLSQWPVWMVYKGKIPI